MSAYNDLELARALANKFHEGQLYGLRPYVIHLAQVEKSVKDDFQGLYALYQQAGVKVDYEEFEPYIQVVALLHDFLEDTDGDVSLLQRLFPDWVVNAIVHMTKYDDETEEDYLAECKRNLISRFVKFHDAKCNMEENLRQGNQKRAAKYMRKMALMMED